LTGPFPAQEASRDERQRTRRTLGRRGTGQLPPTDDRGGRRNLSASSIGIAAGIVVGGVLAAAMIPLRNMMEETVVFRRCQNSGVIVKSPVKEVLLRQPKAVLLAFLISTVGSVSYFLNISYVPTFLDSVVHFNQTGSLVLGTLAAAVIILVTPLVGYLSDRVGRRPTMVVIGMVLVLSTIPCFAMLLGGSTSVALVGTVALAVPAAAWSAVAASAVPEQFAAIGRFAGMAIGYNLATTLFGGLSPLIATLLLESTGWKLAPAAYATVIALAALPTLFLMRETAGRPLPDRV
jgi:MHS family proline/betaine transporter-like MFS transporter